MRRADASLEGHDSLRIVQMSLESGASGPLVDRAVDEAVALGQTAALVGLVLAPPNGAEAATKDVLARLVQPSNLSALLTSEPLDIESLDSLLPFMTPEGYEVSAGRAGLGGKSCDEAQAARSAGEGAVRPERRRRRAAQR